MNKFWLVFIVYLTISLSSNANVFAHKDNLSNIAKNLPEFQNISCKFAQEKYIPSSNLTLKSGGDFKFEKDKGVTFFTTYPIKSTTTYSQNEHKQINSIIKAITNKQYSKLEKDFDFYYEKNNDTWDLGLKPKQNTNASNYLISLEISGQNNISKIIITTKDKNKTTIKFFK